MYIRFKINQNFIFATNFVMDLHIFGNLSQVSFTELLVLLITFTWNAYMFREAKLFTHYSLLVTFYSLLVTFYSWIVTFYSLLVTSYSLLINIYSLLVTRYFLLVTRYFLLVDVDMIAFRLDFHIMTNE